MIARRLFLALLLPVAAASPALAQQPSIADVADPIESFNEALIMIMKAGRSTTFDERYNMLNPVVQKVFDLPTILRASIGSQHANLDPQQSRDLLKAFTRFTVSSFVANFNDYKGERIDISPKLRSVGQDAVVDTQILSMTGNPVKISYVMRKRGSDWAVADILMDGSISRVAVQRSDFRSVLTSAGAPALIASLQRKTEQLSEGTPPT